MKSRPRDVFNAFHELDEKIVVVLPARRECDPAVSLQYAPQSRLSVTAVGMHDATRGEAVALL